MNLFRTLKTIHGWLGILILPWILIAGMTGFYLNHERAVGAFFPSFSFDESQFAQHPASAPVDAVQAVALARQVFPDQRLSGPELGQYHGHKAYLMKNKRYRVNVAVDTGHYWAKTPFTRRTYAPDGTLLHTKYYIGNVLETLHTRGWVGVGLPTLIADITAIALMVFSLSGMYLFLSPRLRKWQGKRRARRLAAERTVAAG